MSAMLRSPRLLMIASFVFLHGVATPSYAGQCRKVVAESRVDTRNSVRLRELQCQLDRDRSLKFSVKFQALDPTVASVLLYKGKAFFAQVLYGKTKVIENAMLKEYRTLLDKFGVASRYENDPGGDRAGIIVDSSQRGGSESIDLGPRSVVKALEFPLYSEGPFHEDILHILKQPTWPAGFHLSYDSPLAADADIESFAYVYSVWRAATRDDFLELPRRLQRYSELVVQSRRVDRDEKNDASETAGFFSYITRHGLPNNFLYYNFVVGSRDCTPAEGQDFTLNGGELSVKVDVAFVQNTSAQSLKIEKLFGAEQLDETLRKATTRLTASPNALSAPAQSLEPGETLVVPLRLLFDVSSEVDDGKADVESDVARLDPEQVYKGIKATKPGTTFEIEVETFIRNNRPRGQGPNTYKIIKTRESFTPHTEPDVRDHVYGPEWQLSAVNVGGETFSVEDHDTDVVSFTTATEAGSCPVLYVWSEEDQHWERRGKVIHKAQGKANAQSETVRFTDWQPRFRIVEEELEVAHLDGISAVIVLDDGTTRDLGAPRSEARGARLSFPVSFYYGEGSEMVFKLPEGIDPERVIETRLTVSGYYERYSSLLVERARRGKTRE